MGPVTPITRKIDHRALALRAIAAFLMGACVVLTGCSGRAKMADDPFRRPGGAGASAPPSGSSWNDPRYNLPSRETFERANEAAREKDVSADISTDPLRDDPKLADLDKDTSDVFRPASQKQRLAGDPLLGGEERPALTPKETSKRTESIANLVEGSPPIETYERIRERLEEAGAKHWKFDREDGTGVITFSCEVPYPDNPATVRVFEARSLEELKAMLAVTEQVERWRGESR